MIKEEIYGNIKQKKNGHDSATWTSVGSGNYYLIFTKADDGFYVDADPVEIYN